MLAHNRVVLLERKLFRLGPGIFLGDVKETSIRRAGELDLDSSWLGHVPGTLNRLENGGARVIALSRRRY